MSNFNKSFSYAIKLATFFLFDGKKLFATKIINNSFFNLFFLATTQDISQNHTLFLEKNKINLAAFIALLKLNTSFFNINFLLKWYLSFLTQIFNIKCIAVAKKYKKKYKKKYTFKLYQVSKAKRDNIFFKAMSLNTSTFGVRSIYDRFLLNLLTTISSYKQSSLYKKKIFIYKWALRNKLTAENSK